MQPRRPKDSGGQKKTKRSWKQLAAYFSGKSKSDTAFESQPVKFGEELINLSNKK